MSTMDNLVGQSFGSLLVTSKAHKKHPSRKLLWNCSCTCGNSVVILGSKLKEGRRVTCGSCGGSSESKHHHEVIKAAKERIKEQTRQQELSHTVELMVNCYVLIAKLLLSLLVELVNHT